MIILRVMHDDITRLIAAVAIFHVVITQNQGYERNTWRRNVKRFFKKLIFVAAVAVFFAEAMKFIKTSRNGFYSEMLISGMHAKFLSELIGENQMEDAGMQIVYQLARRSVVKIVVNDSAASGLVWKIDDKDIVIVSNRHLLMKDVTAEVAFYNGERADAGIIGYSQQYDIGFLKVSGGNVTARMLRDIYEAVPAEYEMSGPDSLAGRAVLQIGADLDGKKEHFSTGSILGFDYEPVFNTTVLKTKCYARAGMSGGGVFDTEGKLLGMLSGGEVAEDAEIREAEVSYSLPVALIADEYDNLNR